jgi:hypothetical protein
MDREWNATHLNVSTVTYIDRGALGYAKSLQNTFGVPLYLGLDRRADNV